MQTHLIIFSLHQRFNLSLWPLLHHHHLHKPILLVFNRLVLLTAILILVPHAMWPMYHTIFNMLPPLKAHIKEPMAMVNAYGVISSHSPFNSKVPLTLKNLYLFLLLLKIFLMLVNSKNINKYSFSFIPHFVRSNLNF